MNDDVIFVLFAVICGIGTAVFWGVIVYASFLVLKKLGEYFKNIEKIAKHGG